jgi:ribosomal protein S18 acetylase RimI-like enzyme
MPNVTVSVVCRDLTEPDLDALQWSGTASHLVNMREQLRRVESAEVEYLVVAASYDLPIGKLGIDYTRRPGAGTIYQAAVHPALQSCGIGSLLMREAERRIRARGLAHAELGVEQINQRARALYERLGYLAYADAPEEWDAEGPAGEIVRYRTMGTLMRKALSIAS